MFLHRRVLAARVRVRFLDLEHFLSLSHDGAEKKEVRQNVTARNGCVNTLKVRCRTALKKVSGRLVYLNRILNIEQKVKVKHLSFSVRIF